MFEGIEGAWTSKTNCPKSYCFKWIIVWRTIKIDTCFFFWSLLIVNEVFKEVQLGFFVINHTHEDNDGIFGYLSKKLKEQNNYVLVDLMKAIMALQEWPFIPQLIQKIPDFRSWVQGYLKDEYEVLVGYINMHFFQFFVDSSRWPMMYNKMFPICSIWSPKDGPTIWLWKFDDQGRPKLPNGIWKLVFFPSYLGGWCFKGNKEKIIHQ